ncbi:hypothetical protein Aph01nite_43330 [Acrocarpospora phusangensis]|uniref:Uncharacterized protein n=1 Tax=Acrocarpospora phusangensis TaxID=1070424 RepID=A0A919QEI9_9ACTN|nr:hypothetical protein [Acrocarpospora phusangensis]GIH26023.1 hypothetical protein Aph01nite_43330 [Acrocarpospora phusangensis]
MTTITLPNGWIRPWYPSGLTGHADPECPDLLAWEGPEPAEGPGWLNPNVETDSARNCRCVERAAQ